MHFVWFAAGLSVLVGATIALPRLDGVGLGWLPLWGLARAAVQLTVVALLLRGVLSVPGTVVAFLALMLTTASLTSGERLTDLPRGRAIAAGGVVLGAAVGVGAVLALRLVAFEARYVVAVAGILVGNAMSAATLSGRNFVRSSRARSEEIEAWLSLGATPEVAHRDIGREAVRESLLPNLDQAKSTGLITLPGAFVGALFGGASPGVAAQFQLVVLAGIALTMTISAIVVTRRAGRSPFLPARLR